MRRRGLVLGGAALGLFGTEGLIGNGRAWAQSRVWRVDPSLSALRLEAQAFGSSQGGRFDDWDSEIVFDPDRPEAARVSLRIRAASLRMDEASTTDEARGSRFLDVARHPEIAVRLTRLTRMGPAAYRAMADVTCKGIVRAVVFPASIVIEGPQARIDATVVLDREAFDIGTDGPWSLVIGKSVRVDIAIVAREAVA